MSEIEFKKDLLELARENRRRENYEKFFAFHRQAKRDLETLEGKQR